MRDVSMSRVAVATPSATFAAYAPVAAAWMVRAGILLLPRAGPFSPLARAPPPAGAPEQDAFAAAGGTRPIRPAEPNGSCRSARARGRPRLLRRCPRDAEVPSPNRDDDPVDLATVTQVRPARDRADLVLAPGEAPLAGGTWLYSEPQPHLTGLVDLTTLGWPAWTERPDGGLSIAATCTLAELVRIPDRIGRASGLLREGVESLLQSFKV